MSADNVNHPKHYGGEENPYETIKVLEARMSPIEVMGFLKGNAYKYNDRAAEKGQIEDFKKARWYQNRIVEFGERVGAEALFPPTYFWDNAGQVYDCLDEAIAFVQTAGEVEAVHSNVAPFIRFVVGFQTTEDGDVESETFIDLIEAHRFKAGLQAEADRLAAEKKAQWHEARERGKRRRTRKAKAAKKPAARKRR